MRMASALLPFCGKSIKKVCKILFLLSLCTIFAAQTKQFYIHTMHTNVFFAQFYYYFADKAEREDVCLK